MNKSRKTPRQKYQSRFTNKIKRFFFFLVFMVILSSLTLVSIFRYLPLPTSAFMMHQHFTDFQNGKGFVRIRYQWIDKDKISPFIFAAVIASEDQRFYQHSGFDFNAIASALEERLNGRRLRGASTISQQVAKNLFLSPSRSLWRKAAEVWFTLLIELLWDKQRILEVYVNLAEFGDHIFGIESASRHFFDAPAKNLTASRAALLAATLPNPKKFRVNHPSNYVLKKQQWILQQMKNLGHLK